jgi:hypothetical protein
LVSFLLSLVQRETQRCGSKKADWTRRSFEEAQQLKALPDASTPVGRHNRLWSTSSVWQC